MQQRILTGLVLAGLMVAFGLGRVSRAEEDDSERPPQAVLDALKQAFPKAKIDETETEEVELTYFEFEMKEGDRRFEVAVSEDGTIILVERGITRDALPAPVAKTLGEKLGQAEPEELEQAEHRARARFVALPQPETVFQAEWKHGDKTTEVVIAADGSVVSEDTWTEEGDDEHDDDGEGEPGEGR